MASPAAPAATLVMPRLVGLDLQSAQNRVQDQGLAWSRSHDLAGSRAQIVDSNWLVCTQNIAPGTAVSTTAEGSIDLGVVKRGEACPGTTASTSSRGGPGPMGNAAAPAATGNVDKGFRLENVTFNNQEYVGATAAARITNTTTVVRSGMFTISILDASGAVSRTFTGAGNEVAPGQTVTVEFLGSGGNLPAGKVHYTFQTSAAFDG